jgi:hypothetical protein
MTDGVDIANEISAVIIVLPQIAIDDTSDRCYERTNFITPLNIFLNSMMEWWHI